jgi:hypothetical protein
VAALRELLVPLAEPRCGAGSAIVNHDARGGQNWHRIDNLRALSTRIRQQTPRE